jgi:hypothetical protein
MRYKKTIIAVVLSTLWVGASEFIRNQILFKSFWTELYHDLGLVFPEKTVNGLLWGIWSLFFASLVYTISQKFSFRSTVIISWCMGFLLMWLVIGNLGFLPVALLLYAIPLSVIEVVGASMIVKLIDTSK